MAKRPIKIQQLAPTGLPFAICPIGLFCNQKLQKAEIGDEVTFCFEYRRDKRVITNIARFRINTPEFAFMLRSIYGAEMTIPKLLERWQAWAVVEEIGKDGFDKEQCIIIQTAEI